MITEKYTINNKIITFGVPESGNVAICMSGGIESTALLYLVANIIKMHDLPTTIQPIVAIRQSLMVNNVNAIIDYVIGRLDFRNIKQMIYGGNTDLPDIIMMHEYIKYVVGNSKFSMVYLGDNAIPSTDNSVVNGITFNLETKQKRKANTNPSLISRPFINLLKNDTINLFYDFGISELIKYTHTCTQQEGGSCGKCFSCQERAWGFALLNKEDPGCV